MRRIHWKLTNENDEGQMQTHNASVFLMPKIIYSNKFNKTIWTSQKSERGTRGLGSSP